jgi:AraC-like DNA-binding protein
MRLIIKNMVCRRCQHVVREELRKIGIQRIEVEFGEVYIFESICAEQIEILRKTLLKNGLELLDSKKRVLIDEIKATIFELVHYCEQPITMNISVYLSQRLRQDYSHLCNLFTEVRGITLEEYYIAEKIERVKELLVYHELTMTQIATRMRYSSVAHLSTEFRKVTGLNASHFKQLKDIRRSILSTSQVF